MDGSHYLTRMEINPRRRAARRYLGSPQVMHAAVEASFPASTAGERRLWRIDRVGEGVWLYILSATRPDLTHVVEEIGRPATQGWVTKDYAPFLDRLAPGQVWAFRLTANPTHSGRRSRGSADTQRFGHLTVAQQEQWLSSRLGGWGTRSVGTVQEAGGADHVAPVSFAAVGREVVQFTHAAAGAGRRQITLTRTSFEGALEVVDPEALRVALVNGMGHAKSYGCGLMTLARP